MSVRVKNPDSIALPVSIGLQSNTSLCSETSQTDFCIATDVELSESGDLIMEPDQEVAIHVLTRADLPLDVMARGAFAVSSCFGTCDDQVLLSATVTDAFLRCAPVDFGAVFPETSRSLNVVCVNQLESAVVVEGWRLMSSAGSPFQAEPSRSVTVGPQDPLEIEVAYAPSDLEDATAVLLIDVQGTDTPVEAFLRGSGGGPRVELPSVNLDFGLTSLVVPIVRSFLVQNVGFEDLRINSVDVDGSPPTRATSRRRSAARPSTWPHACSSSRLASILGSCLWTQRPWAPSR